jgi:hypothetical protein
MKPTVRAHAFQVSLVQKLRFTVSFGWCVSNAKVRKSQCLMIFSDYTYEAAWKGHELLLQWIVEQEAEGVILPVCENPWKHPVLRKHERQTTKRIREYDNGFIFGFST